MTSPNLSHTARVKVLTDLLARLEAAEGADRELDALICAALRYLPPDCREAWAIGWEGEWRAGPGNVYLLTAVGKSGASFKAAPLTASLDASLALVERVLPENSWCISQEPTGRYGASLSGDHSGLLFEFGPTPALALLCALVKALIAKEGQS